MLKDSLINEYVDLVEDQVREYQDLEFIGSSTIEEHFEVKSRGGEVVYVDFRTKIKIGVKKVA